MTRPIKVLSISNGLMGNAVYHDNLCTSLKDSAAVEVIPRYMQDYFTLKGRMLRAGLRINRLFPRWQRFTSEWVCSEVTRWGVALDIRKIQPDVLHFHTHSHSLRSVSFMRRWPTVVSMDATSHALLRLPAYAFHEPGLQALGRREAVVFQHAAISAGITHWVTASLKTDYAVPETQIRLTPPIVDTTVFRPAPAQRADGTRCKVLFVGHDLERKGGLDLIHVITHELASGCELDVVSGATPPANLPSHVRWHTGIRPRSPELIALYQGADVFALPSREECYGMVYVEAMACGLPLIGSNIMGVPDLVHNNENGFSLNPGDRLALARALSTLAQSPELRRRFGAASRRMAEESFSLSAGRRVWEEVFLAARGRSQEPGARSKE